MAAPLNNILRIEAKTSVFLKKSRAFQVEKSAGNFDLSKTRADLSRSNIFPFFMFICGPGNADTDRPLVEEMYFT